MSAAFAVTQRQNQSILNYPTAAQLAGQAAARRNLNVQPTIKIPAGYKFVVRVNRDIVFDRPYLKTAE